MVTRVKDKVRRRISLVMNRGELAGYARTGRGYNDEVCIKQRNR
jgi:hypothetical protein